MQSENGGEPTQKPINPTKKQLIQYSSSVWYTFTPSK